MDVLLLLLVVVVRLLLWLLVGAPAVREFYEFIQGSSGSQTLMSGLVFHKLGTFAWLALAVSCWTVLWMCVIVCY
jgi:hypothetical protein